MSRGRRRSREAWAKHIEKQAASGLTIGEYCEVEKLSPGSFSSWKWRLGKEAADEEPVPRFAELAVVSDDSERIELTFGNGLRLLFPVTTETAVLAAVVEAASKC